VPDDFALHAHVAPGGGPGMFDVSSSAEAAKLPKAWDLKFDASGRGQSVISYSVLRRNTLDVHHVRQPRWLSRPQLLKLVAAVNQADFYSLPTDLCTDPLEHSGSAYLKITMNGRTHEVTLCAWAMQRDMRGVKRLERIWRALLSAQRSPNDNKELRWFKEGSGGLSISVLSSGAERDGYRRFLPVIYGNLRNLRKQ